MPSREGVVKKGLNRLAGGERFLGLIEFRRKDLSMYRFDKVTAAAAGIALAAAGVPAQASASASGAANPCATGMQGCVLPVKGAVAEVVEEAAGFPILPILLGIAAIAGIIAIAGGDDDDDPVSP